MGGEYYAHYSDSPRIYWDRFARRADMGIKDKLIALGDLPQQRSVMTLRGMTELLVENCLGVSGYDEDFITLSVYGSRVTVSGTPLMLESFGMDGVKITGKIHSLSFEEE